MPTTNKLTDAQCRKAEPKDAMPGIGVGAPSAVLPNPDP